MKDKGTGAYINEPHTPMIIMVEQLLFDIPVAAFLPHIVTKVRRFFFFRENYRISVFPEMEHRLQFS